MPEAFSLTIDVSLTALALLASYYSVQTYFAFRGDVMERVFGFMSVAYLILAAAFSIQLVAELSDATTSMALVLIKGAGALSFVLVLAGLVPLMRWSRGVTESRSEP